MSHSHSAYIISEETQALLVQPRDTFRRLSECGQFREAMALLRIPEALLAAWFGRMAEEVTGILDGPIYVPAERHWVDGEGLAADMGAAGGFSSAVVHRGAPMTRRIRPCHSWDRCRDRSFRD